MGISLWRQLGLERSLLWASLRALVQLLLVGWVLQFVVDPDDPLILSVIWLLAMIGFAAYTTSRRAADVPNVLPLSMIAYAASAVVVLGVLFGFGIYDLEGRTLVPLAGMVVGNSLAATVLVSRQLLIAANEQRGLIEARLALGLTASEAFQPHLRQALRTALVPQIESTKAVGIVFLPGAMVGLDPGRGGAERRGEGPGVGDVSRARQRGDDHGGDESRHLPRTLHLRTAAPPPHPTPRLNRLRRCQAPA